MIELPGSFSGIEISPMPLRGPLASHRTSFAIFVRLAASVRSVPCRSRIASWDASAWNLFSAVT
jgi:hypothetical protein